MTLRSIIQLDPTVHHATIKCRVLKLLLRIESSIGCAYEYLVGDATGTGILSSKKELETQWYELRNVRIRVVKGVLRIISDPWWVQVLEPEDPIVDHTVDETTNISLVEYEYVSHHP
jgi:hypothetical protein